MKYRLAVLAFVVVAAVPAQTTRLVPSQYPTIQSAINACVNGDTVLVAPGNYAGAVNFTGKTISVVSSGGGAVTTISGAGGSATVTFQGGEGPLTQLQGFTIQNGGPGIYCHNASPQISACTVVNNFSSLGTNAAAGGIRCRNDAGNGSPTITGCVIANNAGFRGGGLSFETTGAATMSPAVIGCTVSTNFAQSEYQNNYSGSGAGIHVEGAVQITVLTTTVQGNSGISPGGGIFSNGTSLLVDRCRIMGCHAYSGAAIRADTACTIIGSLLAANVNSSFCQNCPAGGTVEIGGGSAVIQASTIAGNQTSGISGGILLYGGTLNLTNTIVFGNSFMDLYKEPQASISATACDIGIANGPLGPTNFSADPRFVDLAGGDFHIGTGSPCRDAGTPGGGGLPPVDLDGTTRVVGPAVDVGVDEIPSLAMPGTPDGLDLYAWINGAGDPLASTRSGLPGSVLTVTMKSSSGSLVGGLPLFAARLYFTGNPFSVLGGGIWLDGQSVIVYGALAAPPFGFPGLPQEGLDFTFLVPPGLAGHTVRMQGMVTAATAVNGIFATTNATEVTF
jgi:hypothetical protein